MSPEAQEVRIKPSLIPFTWKSSLVVLFGLAVYVANILLRLPAPILGPLFRITGLALICLGILGMFVGVIRRNTYTYTISNSDLILQRQLLRRSVRRIPFTSITDVQVSQSLAGRLAGYGNVVPVTKSGFGLVRGVEPGENIVAEMVDVPHPDKIVQLIMSRLRANTPA